MIPRVKLFFARNEASPFDMNKMILVYFISSLSLSFNCALRESGCRIGYEPTKNELRSLSAVDIQDTNVEVSALSLVCFMHGCHCLSR